MCFSSLDEVRTFHGGKVVENAFYYIETSQTVLFQGKGVYMGEVVKVGLEDGIISPEDIKYFVKTKTTIKGKFKPFVEHVFTHCGKNAKYIINTFIGAYLGKTLKNTGRIRYTDDLNTASIFWRKYHPRQR